ncbi:MAG TPA: hypothetical protein VL403_17940 [Candidatus Kryptonia bacterium]|nr:hypothetical protein [Candidatus Kryptonia bacterium]
MSHVVIVGVDDDAGADGGQPVLSELSVVMADSTGVGSGPGVRGPPAPQTCRSEDLIQPARRDLRHQLQPEAF